MSDQTQEPTMEEILASIRRIISEDDAPAAEAAPAAALPTPEPAAEAPPPPPEPEPVAAAPEPEPVPQPEPAAVEAQIEDEEEEEILELTERVAAPETHGDLDVYSNVPETPRAPPPAPEPAMAAPPRPVSQLVSAPAASAAATAFGQLSAAISMPRDGRTLEDVVRELLNPLLAAWLDEHLPAIVQAKVDEEVERIARGRVR
jgi:cell pole-organizing protein PopZ